MNDEIVRVTSTHGREKFRAVKANSLVSVLAIGEEERHTVESVATLIRDFFSRNGHTRLDERREMGAHHPTLFSERYESGKRQGYECSVKIKRMGGETYKFYSREQRDRRHDYPMAPRTGSWDRYIVAFDVKTPEGGRDPELSLKARDHFLEYVEQYAKHRA